MKTVSGKLISSKPISVSKAAKILSGFAGHEHGASDAVSVYLNRAADAFNSLVSFHKELKNPHSYLKERTPHVKIEENPDVEKVEIRDSRGKSKKNADFEVKIEEQLKVEELRGGLDLRSKIKAEKDREKKIKIEHILDEVGDEMGGTRIEENDRKKKIKIEQISDEVGDEMGGKRIEEKVKIEQSMDIEQATPDKVGEKSKKKKHKKKKVKNEEPIKIEQSQETYEDGEGQKSKQQADEIEEGSMKKKEKRKRKNRDGEGAGESLELEERKSRDVDVGETIHLAEKSGKKKKRRKTERED